MNKWYLIVDVAKCEDCNNCFLACKDEHVDNGFPGYSAPQPRHGHRWMNIMRRERGTYPLIDVAYRPTPCQHCEDAPCVAAAKDGSVRQREDGIVLIDPVKAKGRPELVNSCPFGAIFWNQEESLAQKCTLCAHLLDQGWKTTRCVQACPTGALNLLKLEDFEARQVAGDQGLARLKGGDKIGTRVLYKNLGLYKRCFVAGSVSSETEGVEECVSGARVSLFGRDEKEVASVTTDAFGDFKLDGLAPDSGPYRLVVAKEGLAELELEVTVAQSLSLPDLRLAMT